MEIDPVDRRVGIGLRQKHGRRAMAAPDVGDLGPCLEPGFHALERGGDYSAEIGTWIGLVGGIVWAVGAFLLAKEPEGDDDWHGTERISTGHTAH